MALTMHLEFKQAMTDFKTMFPDMDEGVIEAVLRANAGGVDATVDQLLAMSTDNLNERVRLQLELDEMGPNCSSPRPITSRLPSVQGKDTETATLVDVEDSSTPLAVRRKWTPKLLGPLPPSFLRIPDSETDLSLEMDDDRLAMYLQNEEFMNELRWNQEFMNTLDNEPDQKGKEHDDEAAFKERLKNMGKLSRKKFAQFSRMFSRNSGGRRGGAEAPPRGPPDRRLLQEEHSDDDDRPEPPASRSPAAHTHLV